MPFAPANSPTASLVSPITVSARFGPVASLTSGGKSDPFGNPVRITQPAEGPVTAEDFAEHGESATDLRA